MSYREQLEERARLDPEAKRFLDKIRFEGKCWLWIASKTRDGYGLFWTGGWMQRAHKVAYHWFVKEVEPGLELDHGCRHRNCVNPECLEEVTHRVNVLRGNTFQARNAAKTHCPAGHPYSPENTYRSKKGQRFCRACGRVASRLYLERKKASL